MVILIGTVQPGEVTPSPSPGRKEWGPFGSPVELSAATSHEASPTDRAPQHVAASADAEAASAASAAHLEASAPSQDGATEQRHEQQHSESARAQHLDSRPEFEAEQEQREQADGPSQALPPENWPSGR